MKLFSPYSNKVKIVYVKVRGFIRFLKGVPKFLPFFLKEKLKLLYGIICTFILDVFKRGFHWNFSRNNLRIRCKYPFRELNAQFKKPSTNHYVFEVIIRVYKLLTGSTFLMSDYCNNSKQRTTANAMNENNI